MNMKKIELDMYSGRVKVFSILRQFANLFVRTILDGSRLFFLQQNLTVKV